MEAPLSLALAIYPPFYAALFARSLIPPTGPSVLTANSHLPCYPLSLLLELLSLVSFARSFRLLLRHRPLATPLLYGFPLRPPRFARFFSSASGGIPEGIPTFLTAATAFIPSSSSPRRAYKGSPESNKSDNARGRETRECTQVGSR